MGDGHVVMRRNDTECHGWLIIVVITTLDFSSLEAIRLKDIMARLMSSVVPNSSTSHTQNITLRCVSPRKYCSMFLFFTYTVLNGFVDDNCYCVERQERNPYV